MRSTSVLAFDVHDVMNMLLIRFGLIVAGLVLLGIVVFAVALRLKRKGTLGETVRRVAPMARGYLDRPRARGPRTLRRGLLNSAIDYVERRNR